jgi:periplasmic protein TonB
MKPRDVSAPLPPAASSNGLMSPSERLAHWLIQRAAHKSPLSLADRLEEEWLADLAAQRGGCSRLRFAIGCCWATRVIAHEHLVASVSAARSATGAGTVTAFAHNDPSFFSRRMSIFLFIVGLHAIVIYGFATGLEHTMIHVQEPMKMTVLSQPRTHDIPPPAPEPSFRPSRIDLPKVDQTFTFPQDTTPTTDTNIERLEGSSLSPSPPNGVIRVLGGPGAGFPNTGAFYPPASRRIGEMGVTTVRVCVDGNGHLSSAPVVAQSSGSASLDGGALELAKAGSGHYRSSTEDGRPVASCYPFRIRFELKK